MTDRLAQNKRTVMAFYDLMFNQCSPAEAVQKYVGEDYIQHNPAVGDGKEALIAYFERMLKEFPGKGLSSSGSLRRKTMSCFTATSSSPETAIRQGSRSRLDDHRKIVEHWDRLQVFPATAANNNTMF